MSGGDVEEVEGVLGVQDRGGFGVAALVVRSPGFQLRTLASREGGISKSIENYKLLTSDDKSMTAQDTAPGTWAESRQVPSILGRNYAAWAIASSSKLRASLQSWQGTARMSVSSFEPWKLDC